MVIYGLGHVVVPSPGTSVQLTSPISNKATGIYLSLFPGTTGDVYLKDKNGNTIIVLNASSHWPIRVGFVYGGNTLTLTEFFIDVSVGGEGPVVGFAVL